MKTTWEEIKTAVYRLMYLEEGEETEYEKYLYDAANYALCEIATKVLPIIEQTSISQMKAVNMVSEQKRTLVHEDTDVMIRITDSEKKAKSYYFACDGNGICTVTNGDGSTSEITMQANRTFSVYKGFAPASGIVSLTFGGDHAYTVKEISLYPYTFSDLEQDIPCGGKYRQYDMLELTNDPVGGRTFYAFAEDAPVIKRNFETGEICEAADFYTEKGTVLYLNAEESGQFEIYYKRYPTKITPDTADSFEVEIAPEACVLMPLLMAYRILKDDDERKAVMYFNEYQNARAEVMRPMTVASAVKVWGGEVN